MKYDLLIKGGAKSDIAVGFQQHRKISIHLGDDFLQKLDDTFERILSGPKMFAKVHQEIRQVKMRRFPFVISDLIECDLVVVIAVLHGHRNTEAWKGRQ